MDRRRIIVDLTDTWLFLAKNERVTGIHRVSLKIVKRLIEQTDGRILLGYYDPRFNMYAHFDAEADFDDLHALRAATQAQYVEPLWPHKLTRSRLVGLSRLARTKTLPTLRRLVSSRSAKPERLKFQDGDIVLSLGCGWNAAEMFRLVEPLARSGAVTPVVMVHDLNPQLFNCRRASNRSQSILQLWLSYTSRYVRNYIVYSESTRRDLDAYLTEYNAIDYRIEKTSLAHEFQIGDPGPVSDRIASLTRQEYVLAVISTGYLDSKNLIALLEAWSRLCANNGHAAAPRLVIAGGIKHADLPSTIAEHLSDRLDLALQPNDSELSLLYQRALFTVLPSKFEGWGLPIGESLWHGKFCVTSNVSSMPEVGGPFCDYFDPHNVDNMVEVLQRPILDRAYLREREEAIDRSALITWDRSAGLLMDAVMRIAANKQSASPGIPPFPGTDHGYPT